MSAAATPARARPEANRRRVARYPLTVPVNITVLHAGRPDNIPGRALNVGEWGMFAALAGELHPGDPVVVEFHLPDGDTLFQAKAVIRHHAHLRCGLEFMGLSPKQQTVIRNWAGQSAERSTEYSTEHSTENDTAAPPGQSPEISDGERPAQETIPAHLRRSKVPHRMLWTLFAALLLVAGLGWWQWHRVWDELESRVPVEAAVAGPVRATVSSEVMEQLATHKVDPIYPDAARAANVQGVVVLDAVIGSDGAVLNLRPISGPDLLTSAAMDAVKWWRFEPYRLNGKPVEVETTITLDFRAD